MIGFVLVFDRLHYVRKYRSLLKGENLMTADELNRIQAIWCACQDA
jgi:hypothetical protein